MNHEHIWISALISILRVHTVMGDLILRLRELELISSSSLIKMKFLMFNVYKIQNVY